MRTFTQKLAFLLLTLLCSLGVPMQAAEVIVGDETSTTTATYYPAYSYFNYSYNQQIFTADEIGSAGTISSISLWLSNGSSADITRSIEVYMVEVEKTEFTSTTDWVALTSDNLVYQGEITFPTTETKVDIQLDESFSYGGTDNLLVAFRDVTGSYQGTSTTSTKAKVSPVDGNVYRTLYANRDNPGEYDITVTSTSGTRALSRNVIAFDISSGSVVECDKPESCDITDIATNGATVNFSGGSGTYNLEYKAAGDADWTSAIKNTNQTSYTLSNLTPNTSYSVRVQSVCGDNTSGYKSAASFKTLIGLPFGENFNGSSAPDGWSVKSGKLNDDGSATLSSGYGWSYTTGNGVFDKHARAEIYSTSCFKWLILPELLIPAMEEGDLGYQLTFNVALTAYSGTLQPVTKGSQNDDRFIVLASLDGGANWNILQEWNNAGSAYVYDDIACSAGGDEAAIDISAYAGQSIILAFYGESTSGPYSGAGDNYLHIDNVLIDHIPSCLKPTNLHEIESASTKSSLQIGWTANSEETAWRVQHKVSNDTTAEWITSDVSTNPYTINGLQPFTNYDIRVAAVCSETDFTDYGKTIVAKTASGVPYVEKFDTTTLPGEWKRYEVLSSELIYGEGQLQPVSNGWDVAAANGVFPAANRHLVLNITGANCKHWIVSPTIEVEAGYQLTFDLALTKAAGSSPVAVTPGAQNDDKFIVFISTDGGATWNEKAIWANLGEGFSYDAINPEGQTVKIDLSSYVGQGIKIAFYGESTDADSPSSSNLHIANVKIDLIPACSPALSLVITDLEATSATAVWTSDDAEANWQYGLVADPAADFAPADEDFANNTAVLSAELTGLSEKTNYAFFLRRACEGTNSEPLVKNFRTPAMPIVLPWSENFDTLTSGIPEGWDNSEGTTTSASYKWSKYTDSGNTCLRFDSYSNYDGRTNVLATPRIYLSEDAILSFRWKNPTGGAGEVLISNDEGATRTALVSNLTGISDWNTYEIDLSAYTGSKVIIYFAATSNYGSGDAYLYLDDVAVAAAPDCLKPSGLQISEVTDTTAVIVWNEEADGSSWVYAVAPASAEEPADEAFQSVVVNSIALENLAYNTSYVFYLRKACGSAYSESISIAFKTLNPYELTVNDGTSTNSYVPVYGLYVDEGAHSQFIIPAETLASLAWDTITDLTFHSSSASVSWGSAQFEIYMAEVPATTLSALTDWTALTKVKNAGTLAVENGKMEITLDNPFRYQGGNLLIGVHQTVEGTYTGVSWYGVSAPSGSSYYAYGSSGPYTQSFLPKTTFGFRKGEAPPCATPASLHAIDSLATTTSAVLVWTPKSAEENWVVRYKLSSEEDWADSIYVANDTLELTALLPSSAYQAQVATWCDPADEAAIGDFSASVSFFTACGAVATINEGFENPEELRCYSVIQELYNSSYYVPTVASNADKAYEGTNYVYFLSDAGGTPRDQYIISPEVISLEGMRVRFVARKEDNTDENINISVGVMANPDSASTFVEVASFPLNSTTYAPFVATFDSYTGEGKYIAIKMPAAVTGYATMFLDNVVFEPVPACVDPVDIKADSIASDALRISWTPQGSESNWLVRYKKAADAQWADTILASVDTLLINGLSAATAYEIQVAAWCDLADPEAVSPFSGSYIFNTECGIISSFPYSENFDELAILSAYTPSVQTLPLCWNAINTSSSTSYQVYPTAYYYSYTNYANSTPNSLRFYSYYSSYTDYDPQDQYAILPQMENISGLRMRLNVRKYSASYNAQLIVGVMSDPADAATFVAIDTIVPADAAYEPFEIRFNNYAGEGQYIALKAPAATPSITYNAFFVDDIVVEELPNCLAPQGLNAHDATTNSVILSWTPQNTDTEWIVQYKKQSDEEWSSVVASSNDFLLEGLDAAANYEARVATKCGETETSEFSNVIVFATECDIFLIPFNENFNALTSSIPLCWDNSEGSTTYESYKWSYYTTSTDTCLRFNSYSNSSNNTNFLATPQLKLTADAVLTFRWKNPAGGAGEVFISNDNGATRTSLESNLTSFSSWTPFEIDLSAYTGDTVIIYFKGTSNYGSGDAYLYLDDVAVNPLPSCRKVKNLAVSAVTASSASIAWEAVEGQSAWQIAYSCDPEFDLASATPVDIASNPYALSELLTDTLYNVYVRANCGADGFGEWSDKFSFRTAKSCQTPDDLAAADITFNSAVISWNTYGQTGFNLRYINGTDTTLVPNVESPYAISGLDANTLYKVQVQATCEPDQWSAYLNFRTDCDIWSIATGRYVEDFESYAGTAYNVYNDELGCWVMGGNATYLPHVANSGTYGYYPHSGTKALSFYGSANSVSYAVLPQFAEDLNGLQISFWAKVESTSYGTMSIGYMTADSVFHQLTTVPCTTVLAKYEYMLDTVPAGAVRLAFRWVYTGTSYYTAGIDDIEVEFIPTCLAPNAVAASDIFAHSAKISWTNGAEGQSAWQIAYSTAATNKPDTLPSIIDVTENPYVLSGLDPETRYYIYVRAICGEGDSSKFSDGINFRTTVACPAPSALKATLTPGNGSIATLSWSAGAEENAWILEYSLNADLSDSIEVLAYDTFANLTGLTAEATYYARVKADCGELDGKSLYSAVISFKPTDAYELLLNDGTATNEYVPIYGYWTDNYTRSQFIIPAEQLESLEWDSLTVLTFYSSSTNTNWDATAFEVYVDEVPETTMTALTDWNAMTKVMNEASLNIIDNQMVITFDEAYQYQGGNLLIGIKQTASTTSTNAKHTYWYGVSANGASFGGYGDGNNVAQRNFLPKMLINYVPGVAPACPNPKNLVVSGITDSEATFSWKAVEGATWEYALVEGAAEPASFIATTENTVTLNELAEATDYTFYLRRACGEDGYSDATLSVAFTTELHMETLPFEEDFEANAHAWKFVNGEQPNAWTIGNAASNGGDNALYISNDGGVSNAYTNDVAVASFATVLIDFNRPGTFTFAYDWKAKGDYNVEENEQYDYLRVVLVPASAVLTAGTPSLPEGYIALDGGGLYGVTEWQHYVADDVEVVPGQYKLVFAWFNDESDGEDTPAAIDNISIKHKDNPTDIQSGAGIENKAVKFIYNNQVYILLNGNVYNITGQKVELR